MAMNRRILHFSISIKIDQSARQGSDSAAWHVKKQLDFTLATPEFTLKNGAWRVTVEAPAWKQPFLKAGGKALAVLSRFKIQPVKCEWAPTKLYYIGTCSSNPGGRPLLLLSFSETKGWLIEAENLKRISDISCTELMAELDHR